MTVNGKTIDIGRADFLEAGNKMGIKEIEALCIDTLKSSLI